MAPLHPIPVCSAAEELQAYQLLFHLAHRTEAVSFLQLGTRDWLTRKTLHGYQYKFHIISSLRLLAWGGAWDAGVCACTVGYVSFVPHCEVHVVST